jgi:hypothetical protein
LPTGNILKSWGLSEISVSCDPQDRVWSPYAHFLSSFDQPRNVGCRVVCRDPIGLVAEEIVYTNLPQPDPFPRKFPTCLRRITT